jgi:serine/threonine-protein kinase
VYATAAMLWGALTGQRLVQGRHEGEILARVMQGGFAPPSSVAPGIDPKLDAIVMRGLSYKLEDRFQSARDMALALEAACPPASPFEVAEWVKAMGAEALALRAARVREMESRSDVRVSMQDATGAVIVESPFGAGRYDPNQSGVSGVMPGGTSILEAPGMYPASDSGPPSKLTPPPREQQVAPPPPPLPPWQPQTLAFGVPQPLYPPPHPSQPGAQHPSQPGAPHPHPSHPSQPGVQHPSHSGVMHPSHSGVAQAPEHSGTSPVIIALVSVVVTSLLVIGGYMVYARTHADTTVAPAPSASASASAPVQVDVTVPTATVPPLPADSVDVTPDPPPTAAAPSQTSTTPAAPPAVASVRPTTTSRPAGGKRPPAAGTKKPNCDNPFYVDAEGIKQIRPECQ